MFSVVLASLGFLSTTAIGGAPLFMIVALSSIYLGWRHINKFGFYFAFACIVWAALGLFFWSINGYYYGSYADTGSSGLVFPLAIVIGFFSIFVVNFKYLNTFLFLVAFEVFIGYIEYVIGVRSIIGVEFKGEAEFGQLDYLYSNRVFGLGLNSSAFAAKLLFGLVIICYFKSNARIQRYHYYLLAIFISGFFVNFSRTSLVSCAIALIVFLYLHGSRRFFILFIPIVFVTIGAFDYFWNEFTRGGGGIDYSGRDDIFPVFSHFITEHPWLGNFGFKYYFGGIDGVYHAHNSYLQVAATSGLPFLIALLFFIFYFPKFQLIIICLPLLIYSIFQYGLFWGASLYDQIFWFLLFISFFPNYQKFLLNSR